ncbi:MAG: hypothetical protein AAF721_38170 [Myxococcota bacterium]
MTACKGGAGDAVKLIPDSATMVAGVDIKGVMGSKIYASIKDKVEEGGKDGIESAKKCNLGPDTWKSVVVGADTAKGDDAMVAIITADGAGKKENLDCVAKEMKAANGDKDAMTFEEDGKVIKLEGDDHVGYVINDNTIAFAGKDWAASVKELRDGKGKNAMDGSLKELVDRTDTGKHIWFAGTIPSEVGGMAAGPLGFTPKDASGWLDLSSGLALQAAVGGADDAGKVAETLQTTYDGMKGMATKQGLPQGAADSVKIGDKGGAVTVEASMSDDDVKAMMDKAGPMLPF